MAGSNGEPEEFSFQYWSRDRGCSIAAMKTRKYYASENKPQVIKNLDIEGMDRDCSLTPCIVYRLHRTSELPTNHWDRHHDAA